ncbi:MAG TPA: hypothetical protein VFL91_11920 [Thermomicrobiales bacterium]|nr:hypothetical protein [Thermomicrobiales bacterium]
MDIVLEILRAIGVVVAVGAIILVTPLIFMVVFSLVSGFDERAPRKR